MRLCSVLLVLLGLTTSLVNSTPASEIQFVEDFVLARDRAKALEQLVPGTDQYYFFQCIHLQNLQKYDEVDRLLKTWQQRHGESRAFKEIRNRQMLLTYSTHPRKSLDYLIQQLHPTLNHQRDRLESKPKLPAELDPTKISPEHLRQSALRRHKGLQGFEDEGLNALRNADLNPLRRRELLSRLKRPNHPDLIPMILADLKHKGSKGFGSLNIHGQLLLEQLDELRAQRPALENETRYVHIYLQKLQPNADVDWRNDREATEAYLRRLWRYVRNLNASHNSLKAHVLYHWLVLDETRGTHDKQRFLEYLSLPRRTSYIAPRLLESAEARRFPVDFKLNPGSVTLLPPIQNDEPLVKRYFLHFFRTENRFGEYEQYVRDTYLRKLFAEAKITNGLGDPEKWYSLLSPSEYQALKDRVDLDFAISNPRVFGAGDPVQLDLFVKNVEKLIIKVYEINTANYYRTYGREINTDVELDGLVANQQITYEYDDAPELRKRRHFTFPQLTQPGVYVVDFIGNGKSSRAVVRKGKLHHLVKTTAAGHVFTVFNDQLEPLKDVTLWMAGQQFEADAEGSILVPFSTQPGRQSIVLSHGPLSSLNFFEHQAEAYQLKVAAHIEREALLERRDAAVLLRPELRLGGVPVSTQVLENVQVTIQSTDTDGVKSEKPFTDVKLLENRDTPLQFLVPNRLASLVVQITAEVTNGLGKKQSLAASHELSVNQIDQTDKIEDLHLTQLEDVHVLELLGKTGEPKPHRPVRVQLRHKLFRDVINVNLATNEMGLINLGKLTGITQLIAQGPGAPKKQWQLRGDRRNATYSVHAVVGEPIRIPHMRGSQLDRAHVSLYELRGNSYAHDLSAKVKVKDHFVEITGLPAGDYSLQVAGRSQRIRVIAGREQSGFVLSPYRRGELRRLQPLQITGIDKAKDQLRIELTNASPFARVHVYATRFVPSFDAYDALGSVGAIEPLLQRVPATRSYYMAGRKLGDELQYVFERAYGKKYPGNMLQRPTLLLNTWPMRSTQTSVQQALEGQNFSAAADAPDGEAASRARQGKRQDARLSDFANLDFLGSPARVLFNLKPDENGQIQVPLEELGAHQHVHVVALDPLTTVCRSVAFSEITMDHRDLRLKKGLDPNKHYTQQKQVVQLRKDQLFELRDISTGRFETYDSLKSVYELYATLSGNDVLGKFRFVLDWPSLSSDEKQEKYSKYACHELNFFIAHKDPVFFREVVAPYIANKHHKTFLDLWLLDMDLDSFVEPWQYTQLNTVERILLGDRVHGEADRVRRFVQDHFDLIPRDVTRQNQWFNTAIQGKSMQYGLAGMIEEQRESLAEMAPALSAGATAGFGAGGRGVRGAPQASSRYRLKGGNRAVPKLAATEEAKKSLESLSLQRRRASAQDRFQAAELSDKAEFYARLPGRARRLYEKLEKTREWAENNYYQLPITSQNEQLVSVNAFWNDFAKRDKNGPFFSIHWPSASGNFTEMMFALSLLDLPFEPGEHDITFDEQRMTMKAATDMVVFQEQIRETDSMEADSPILITQNYFRANDRYQTVQGVRRDKFIVDEFLAHVVYGCQVVVTNPTSTPRKVQLLVQIPHEAMPTNSGKATKTVDFDLPPYHTRTVDYFFYFPTAGDYAHFPAHVAQDERLLAFADAKQLHVVDEPSNIDKQSWDYVSQFASDDAVLQFLKDHNVFEINLDRIAHRMGQRDFFTQVIGLLQERHAYSATLWAYGLRHDDANAVATYLRKHPSFLATCGAAIESELISVDPVRRRTYQHLDYKPLVNARAHTLGERRQILNNRLHQQYHALLEVLKYRHELSSEDRLALTYYLLLQDRIEEALETFATVDRSSLDAQIQYDYFAAYLDCFRDRPDQARSIVTHYTNYPVPKWQQAFASIKAMLDEIDGNDVLVVNPEDRTQSQMAAAAAQRNLTFTVEDREIRINYQNVDKARINYYLIDLELLFSTNPFVQKFRGQFSHIRPHDTHEVTLPAETKHHTHALPEKLHNRNVLVEIVAGGITRSQAYFSNSLNVQMSENYGQLKVTDTRSGRPIPKTYVKVYAEMQNGSTSFYKDGYTDLRGRFDYSSLSTNDLDFVKRFSILVMDDARGGLVREAQPPKR